MFANIGKAAPPGKYEKKIQKCFEKAEEAKKNEAERVQVDESVEKKDLVAGSLAATVDLPKLLPSPPDQPSCVPYTEAKMKALDAFYCSWMDCCFTCGSSGASDTFLFCVDCGEAFHSFCVSAPVHSMELSSVAGWRCPNCKICEISGDVPPDETRMLFCEMCDRGFSLDLLDPPLTSAPSGLWICGQCVDCKECGNKAEKEGASLRYWSQDPERCFRCGGCGDLVNDSLSGKCQVCAGLLREDDQDVVECFDCSSKVHLSCDERARDYVSLEAFATRAQKAQKDPVCTALRVCFRLVRVPFKLAHVFFPTCFFLCDRISSICVQRASTQAKWPLKATVSTRIASTCRIKRGGLSKKQSWGPAKMFLTPNFTNYLSNRLTGQRAISGATNTSLSSATHSKSTVWRRVLAIRVS